MENVSANSINAIMNSKPANGIPTDGTGKPHSFIAIADWLLIAPGVVQLDPWLSPFKEALRHRFSKAQQWIKTIDETEGGLEKFSRVRTSCHGHTPKTDGL
jgi:1,4-alpha-glucan branching enzyme